MEAMTYPLSVPAAVRLLGEWPFYAAYAIPALAALSIAAALAKWNFVRKTAAYANSALLITSPMVIYTMLGRMYGEMGIVKLKFSSIVCIAAGIGLLITALTDRKDELAHNRMWVRVKKAFEVIITAFFAVIQLYPLVWLFLSSFKNNSEIFSGKVLALPKVWHFENYSRVMFGAQADETIQEAIAHAMARQKDMTLFKFIIGGGSEGNIIRYFLNSTFVVVATVAVVILFGAMASYAISRIKWKHSSLLFTFFILGMMIPVHVALSPLYVVFAEMNLIDSLWSLIIPYIGFGLPIAIIVICGFMETIPYEIEESATIDGANIFTVFFKIIVPMVMPAISTVLIFVFLQSWNELMFATSFINSGVNRTITVGINSIAKSQYNTEYALIFAGLVIASLPTIIIYLAGSQQVQKSLIVGAVKG
jgi:raffinose/stachyose/melibiose transport system permease protein